MPNSPAFDLIRRILEVTGITYYDICMSSRKKHIVQARAIFCHEMRFTQKHLCREIGYCIGRTHTSVSYLTTHFKIDQKLLKKVQNE
jgi:chromosomal replication initiation ATPase DnaA